MIIISSQRYLNDEIVAAKRSARDYTVTLSETFEIDGEVYRIVVDGHHSLAAAEQDGVEPEIVDVNDQIAQEHRAILAAHGPEGLLEICRVDSDYYDIATGCDVW